MNRIYQHVNAARTLKNLYHQLMENENSFGREDTPLIRTSQPCRLNYAKLAYCNSNPVIFFGFQDSESFYP